MINHQKNIRTMPARPPSRNQINSGRSVSTQNKLISSQKKNETRIMGRKVIRQPLAPVVPPKKNYLPPINYTLEEIKKQAYSDTINNNRTCIINQFSGLGDIIFCEPIARMYYEKGYKIIWPVISSYCNVNKHFPYVTFVNKSLLNIDFEISKFYSVDDALVIPLRHSDHIMRVPFNQCMASKYMMWDLPLETWTKTKWIRDDQSEKELFYDVLKLKDGDKYNLISENFSKGKVQIPVPPGKNVYLEKISNYTLIDWSMVMEKASSIHMVGSAINYVLEFLNTNECHLYPRKPMESNFSNYDYLFKKPYIKHL